MAHGKLIPASMVNFDFSKCDSCRRRKKGPCSGDEPCTQCVARGRPGDCTRDLEPAARKRKRAATSANAENESIAATPDISDDIMDTSHAGLFTLRAAAAAEEKAHKEAEEAVKAAESQFISKLPAHLEKWDHDKCDRCRKIKAACDGTEPCPNCIAGEVECTKKEGRKTFSMKRADEIAKQKHKFDVNQAKAKAKKEAKEAKRQEDLRNSEVELSKLLDEKRKIKGSIHIKKMKLNAMVKKRLELEQKNAKPESEKKAEDGDAEIKDAEQDEDYLTQNTSAPAFGDGSGSDLSSAPDSSESDSEIVF